MGVPEARQSVGQTEVWAYDSGNGRQSFTASGTASGNSAFGVVGQSTRRFCKVNIVMRSGTVQAVTYSGPTGGLITQGEQCAYAVQNCLKPQ
jgi:hypothetical protein